MASLEQDIEARIARQMADWQRQVRTPGAPLVVDEAWLRTPAHLRMGYQVLKNAGIPPREVELLQRRAALQEALQQADGERRAALARELADLQQDLALRLERLQRPE